jgi:F0F1-type ATP synthase assembly protein I
VKKKTKDAFHQVRQIGILTTVPFVLLLGPLIGYFAGSWIDRKFGVSPYAMTVFIALGFAASVRETVRIIREISRNN